MVKKILMTVLLATITALLILRFIGLPIYKKITGKQTVATVVESLSGDAKTRILRRFELAQIAYPPTKITLLAIKDQAIMELWAETEQGQRLVRKYPIMALSGVSGPKLREGDRQVPEGIYQIEGLNPNSAYHLSMKLNYPNAFDLKYAALEQRHEPGSNIFIHGKAVSIGCLAMGDSAIEELFLLVSAIGHDNVSVVIAPSDPRIQKLPTDVKPDWVAILYRNINRYFSAFKA